jgi:hypothetical protein
VQRSNLQDHVMPVWPVATRSSLPGLFHPGLFHPGLFHPGLIHPGMNHSGLVSLVLSRVQSWLINDGEQNTTIGIGHLIIYYTDAMDPAVISSTYRPPLFTSSS